MLRVLRGHRAHALARRTRRAMVRFSEDEWAWVLAASGRAGLKPGAWIAERAARTARYEADTSTPIVENTAVGVLETARRELGTLAHEVHELATVDEPADVTREQLAELLGALRRVGLGVESALVQAERAWRR